MKKAQAAMEFLMTYGWAILVVLVSMAALAYFGVLKPEQFLPDKCVISTGSGIFCDDYAISTNGINLRLRNVLDQEVYISSIETVDPSCIYSTGETIEKDSYVDFELICFLTSGLKIKTEIMIDYAKGAGGLSRTTNGQLVAKVLESTIIDEIACQNAQDAGMCDWLNFAFNFPGYREGCCTEYGLCC